MEKEDKRKRNGGPRLGSGRKPKHRKPVLFLLDQPTLVVLSTYRAKGFNSQSDFVNTAIQNMELNNYVQK